MFGKTKNSILLCKHIYNWEIPDYILDNNRILDNILAIMPNNLNDLYIYTVNDITTLYIFYENEIYYSNVDALPLLIFYSNKVFYKCDNINFVDNEIVYYTNNKNEYIEMIDNKNTVSLFYNGDEILEINLCDK